MGGHALREPREEGRDHYNDMEAISLYKMDGNKLADPCLFEA